MNEDCLGRHLRVFLGEYLPRQRGASPRTIQSYRDALKLLLQFVATRRSSSVADLAISDLDREMILAFLEDIEKTRGNGSGTRNHRLAAIRAFFRFVSSQAPELVEQCRQVTAIPLKRTDSDVAGYLAREEVQAIFSAISLTTALGRRDDVLLRFMYNTGARVQEVIDVVATDLHLEVSPHIILRGKGGKKRICPLWPDTVSRLKRHMTENQIDPRSSSSLFRNRGGRPLTRFGVRYILKKYATRASRNHKSLIDRNVHPHTFRHSTAMHLLQAGVDVNTIRCYLGHASIATTNRYVEIDLSMKRRALDAVDPPKSARASGAVTEKSLLAWLESL